MRIKLALILLLSSLLSSPAEQLAVPRSSDVDRYSFEDMQGGKLPLAREFGDWLFGLFEGGQRLRAFYPENKDGGCSLPVEASVTVIAALKAGQEYRLGLSWNGAVAHIPGEVAAITNSVSQQVAYAVALLQLRVTNLVPMDSHIVASRKDGGTLYGIARLLYGDAGHWRVIYLANADVIKDPAVIQPQMRLKVPRLPKVKR
jgi:hypothetical protein